MTADLPNTPIDRRRLLRAGGLALSVGAVAAACGQGRSGSDDPGRIGLAPVPTALPTGEVTDVVLLRTAQSLEYVLIDLYAALDGLGAVNAAGTHLFDRFVTDHTEHAAAVGALIADLDGEEFDCANPWIWDRYVSPVLAAIGESDDQQRDVLNTAQAFETLVATSYQDFVGQLSEPQLRSEGMLIGAQEARHAAVLAIEITGAPGGYFSPAVFGDEVLPTEEGLLVPYAIPSTFGPLTAVDLVVGERSAEGARTVVALPTPAANSYVYDHLSC